MRSDCWDNGNYLTRFYERVVECEVCNKEGLVKEWVYDEETDSEIQKWVDCPECGGSKELYEIVGAI